MRHNDHEIDKLFREKLQQQQEHHSFDKENDWSKLALSLSVSGLVRTGVMSLGAKIFSYAAKTLFIGVMAFVPSLTQSVVSLNSDKNFIAKNSSDKNNIDNTLAQRNQTENLAENSVKSSSDNDFNTKNSFGNNIFDAFLGKNLAEKNTENPLNDKLENSKENSIQNIENQTVTSKENKDLEDDLVTKDKSFIKTQTTLNQTVTSKEKELLVKTQTTAKENSIQNIENQTVTSKEGENLEDNLVAKDKSFIKTQTTLNQTVTSKEKELFVKTQTTAKDLEDNLVAKDKSFIKTQTTLNQTVTNKENKDLEGNLVVKDKLFIKTQTIINQAITNKEDKTTTEKTLKGFNNHPPTWNVGNGQTETDLVAKDKSFIKTQTTLNYNSTLYVGNGQTESSLSASTKRFLTNVNLFENYFPSDFEVKNREIKRLETVETVKKENFAQKFQITLLSPIGTNLKAQKSKHYASVGILASISAGVKGAEVSGLANISTGKVTGLQIAGLTNISRGETKGIQVAGLVNINKEKVQGLQVAGLANISKNKVKGVQIAIIANVSNEQVAGAQVAILGNISKSKVRGLQVATVVNATDTLVGAQIGLINISKNKARGLQIGLVNVVGENNKVLTIGLVSIVKKGGHNIVEMSASEALYGNISLKTGVRKFYNIFAVGSRLTENNNKKAVLMAYGYGIGSEWNFKKKYNISGELMLYALAPDMKFNKNERGALAQAKIMLGQTLNKHWGVFGGVTYNILNSPSGVNIIDKPFTLFNNFKIQDGNVTSWTGLQVGARYFL